MNENTNRKAGRRDFKARYGPWAVVTGASSGIGREMASWLAEAGMDLVLVARRRRLLEELASQLAASHGTRVRIVEADLSDRGQVVSVIEATEDVDVGLLVANAGYGTSGNLLDADLGQELDMLDVNAAAVLMLSHAFGRRMKARGRGGIVLVSSIVAFQGVPRTANYAASKAYVQSLAEGLRMELRAHDVDVLVSAPGPVNSGFADRADMRLGRALDPQVVAAATLRALGRRSMVRPGGQSKLLGLALALTPRRMRTRILGQIMAGFTNHQNHNARHETPRQSIEAA